MWSDNQKSGLGIIVTSSGSYCEAVFSNGVIALGNDGMILNPDESSFIGKIGPDFRLSGKGSLTLTNGIVIEGNFSGSWHSDRIEIHKGILNNSKIKGYSSLSKDTLWRQSLSELQIARLDKRIGSCTVLASNKWQPLYEDCERMLGFSGNAASDVLTAWNRIARGTMERQWDKQSVFGDSPLRRASSMNTLSKTVRAPGELISLERARALTLQGSNSKGDSGCQSIMDDLEASMRKMSIEYSLKFQTKNKIKISGPLHLQDEITGSYPPNLYCSRAEMTYSPHADSSPPMENRQGLPALLEEESLEGFDQEEENDEEEENLSNTLGTDTAIQGYIDQAFNTPVHPLGILMNQLEMVFRESYGGIGANRFLLPHAISEVQYIIKRLHGIIRILFPYLDGKDRNITSIGLTRLGETDPEDYLCIDSGYLLVHPLVFQRIFPTLKILYILHHSKDDKEYSKGIDILSKMDNERLVHFVHYPQNMRKELMQPDNKILKGLLDAATVLQKIKYVLDVIS
jgi:amyotrophic lateral sclerosis 2 protein